MAQIRNKFDIKDSLQEVVNQKRLPNFFAEIDDIKPVNGILFSVLFHVLFGFLLLIIAAINTLIFPHLPKPELPNKGIEFKLVQNESKPPINKNTKIRSDRDSQAGGKHDPNKKVAEPSKKAAPSSKSSQQQKAQKTQPQKQQPQKVVQKNPVKTPQKPVVKPQQKPVVTQKPVTKPQQKPVVAQKPVAKPTPVKAPTVVKPVVKPSVKPTGVSAPSAPKVATAPKSPFAVPTPTTKAPVGSTYKPAGAPTSQGGASSPSVPAPKFSASAGSPSSGPSSPSKGSYASRGSTGGYGQGGNPSPGNPNGAPGIDAIRQPNWGPYMRDLEQRIKRNWTPPKGDSSKRVVITFTIGRDGRLLSHKITKSSGVPLADRAAMSAIELTAPFRPLPPEFKGQSVPIEFTFDYNVLNSVLR